MTRRHRRLLFVLVVGLAVTACRRRHQPPLAAEDIAGRWVIDFVGYTGATGGPHYVGIEAHDTLNIFADGRWITSRTSTRYTMRHDSIVFPAHTGERAFAVRMIGPGEPRLSLTRRVTSDFTADGLPESAVQEMAFRRVGPGETSRTR
jgi:hypothetical protein